MEIAGLKHLENISPRLISRLIGQKKSTHFFKKIKAYQKEEFEKDGWEIVPSRLKKSIKAMKSKPHNIAFEDRIWALFARMGFEYLNEDQKYKIEYQPGLKKQIDVIAANKEAILVIECKSTEIQKKVSYQKDINELIGIKEKLRSVIARTFPGKAKVAFIFATNNSILSENDRKRLKEAKIFHFNQDDFDYYEQITEHLGSAAKYQLFGKLFRGQKIPELKNRVPAIKGKVASGHTFYSFSIEPEFLLKIGFILHRTQTNKETALAYQRLVKKARLNKIAKYIDGGGYFPNSIIINIITKGDKELQFDEGKKIIHDSYTKYGVLHLPQVYRGTFIIDGQHRLYGYSKTKSKSHHTIPVVAFHNLPEEEQAHIFIDINQTQKSIPANLLASIMADFNWGSPNDRAALAALKTRLYIEMSSQDYSPFYKRIILAEEKQTDIRCLTLKTILDWGLNPSNFFGRLKGDKLIKTGYLTDIDHEKTLEKSISFFNLCFGKIQNELKQQWDRGKTEGGFIAMNIGVTAIIRTLDCILEYLVKQTNITPENMTGEKLAEAVMPYLDPVINFIKNLDSASLKKFRGYFGSGATEKVLWEFKREINKDFADFKPEGLEQWIKESSGKFNVDAMVLGNHKIQPLIDEFIKRTLIKEYGEKNWWFEIPEKIRLDCVRRKEEERSEESPWKFLDTIHYKEIIESHWSLLGDFFMAPGMEKESKKRKLEWLVKLNSIRKKYSHPQREPVTEEECNNLKRIYEWLQKKLAI